MEAIATCLRKLFLGNEELPLSVQTVVSNDDLLNQIFLRLPVISLVLFKSVSKRWLSLIKDAAFIKRRGLIPKIDPPSGLFIKRASDTTYGSVLFDIRIPLQAENIFKTVPGSSTTILESCNGLFLCFLMPGRRFCVYNPTLNLFKVLPEPYFNKLELPNFTRMDFDPTKSLHYKVMHATDLGHRFRIQTYSSETGVWSIVCSCRKPFEDLSYEIYWNDAIHWVSGFMHKKLEFQNIHIVVTEITLPKDESYKMYKSRGCLLLIGEEKTRSHHLNIYEMRNGHSEWSMKYSINHTRITLDVIRCVALGEREDDSFMVLAGGHKNCLYIYNFALKTFRELPDLQSILPTGGHNHFSSYLFIASFASV